MQDYGKKLAVTLKAPCVIELLGDVGAGKTTLVQGLAAGLGVTDPVTSPSFTISKQYQGKNFRLIHYDLYRLADPGIMLDDLAESIHDPKTITLVEWGDSVQDILPNDRIRIIIRHRDENTRELIKK